MPRKTIKDIDIQNKRVIIRADFNVPLDGEVITDDARIVKSLPTIEYALGQNAKIILMSHLGRPKGERKLEFSLKPVAKRLSELLKKPVELMSDCVGPEAEEKAASLKSGEIILLENLRFHKEETKNDPEFAKKLAALADIYVSDAFGACHRAHASTAGIAEFLPSVAGFLMAKEMQYFDKVTKNPDRPFVAIMGGAKIHDKIKVIESLLQKVDALLVGGGMAYTFIKAQGGAVGASKIDEEGLKLIPQILEEAKKRNVKLLISKDWVVAEEFKADSPTKLAEDNVPDGWMGLDVGPKTIRRFKEVLEGAKLVIWNGPVGVFEWDAFSKGTREIAEFLANSEATVIIGGGDSAAAIKKYGLENQVAHVSTGGGASLEYLEGKVLPGIACLEEVKV